MWAAGTVAPLYDTVICVPGAVTADGVSESAFESLDSEIDEA